MLTEVKKCTDSNDIKGLHYIFVDCLDVDPTFEKYAADFEYCKNMQGFLVPHMNMTPIMKKERWDKQYWEQLKLDLMKNFSEERFSHMREVAKVIYADKVDRLHQERVKRLNEKNELPKIAVQETTRRGVATLDADKQQKELLEKKRALELHNQQVEREQQAQRERIEEQKKLNAVKQHNIQSDQTSKKHWGVVIAVAAIIVVVVLIKVL